MLPSGLAEIPDRRHLTRSLFGSVPSSACAPHLHLKIVSLPPFCVGSNLSVFESTIERHLQDCPNAIDCNRACAATIFLGGVERAVLRNRFAPFARRRLGVAGAEKAIEARGAELRYLPECSPDRNPIELVFRRCYAKWRGRTVNGLERRVRSFIRGLKTFRMCRLFQARWL
jgi:transposase